jgi:phytoene dehydrogenase-like protein
MERTMIIVGGSKAAIDRMVALYEGLGGEIRHKHQFTDILVESDRAVSPNLVGGEVEKIKR